MKPIPSSLHRTMQPSVVKIVRFFPSLLVHWFTTTTLLSTVVFFSFFSPCVDSANWAQVSGEPRQNTANPAVSPWARRWGFAMTVIEKPLPVDPSDTLNIPDSERSRIFILGGDSYKHDTSDLFTERTYYTDKLGRVRDPNYNKVDNEWADTGSGNLLNDIWWTTGASWKVYLDERIRGMYNDPTPLIVSQTEWNHITDWPGLPSDVDGWRESLACCHPTEPFPCTVTDEYGTGLCEAGVDLYAPLRRFSPRRGHVAITVYKDYSLGSASRVPSDAIIVVLGGRARSYERMTGDELAGGFIGDPFAMEAERHRSVLMSDVWISADGEKWDFTNPGCWVPSEDQTKDIGVFKARCLSDFDCWKGRLGDAYCLLNPGKKEGHCVCRHWSPRERFAAAAVKEVIYIAGGVRYSQQMMCGRFSCGNEYQTHLNDVWKSDDLGRTWVQLTTRASWEPRSDFSLVYASGRLWLFGGRGGEPLDLEYNPLFNDAYVSSDGVEWTQNISNSGFSPRAYHSVLVGSGGTALYLLMGEEQYIPPAISSTTGKVITDETVLTPAQLVAIAAAKAPSNVIRTQAEAYMAPLPGEEVNGMQMIPTDTVYTHYLDDITADTDLYGRKKNIWWKDYGPEMPAQSQYVEPNTPLAQLGYNTDFVNKLASVDIYTVKDLSMPDGYVTLKIRDPGQLNLPDICQDIRRAQYLMVRCSVTYRPYDAEFFKYVIVIEAGVEPPKDVPENIGCDDYPMGAWPDWKDNGMPCRQHPVARRAFGSAVMNNRLYMAGGWEETDIAANDMWYRDERIPLGTFTKVPGDQTSETVFEWTADELGCVFEYQVEDQTTGVVLRYWSRAVSPFDAIDINEYRRATVFRIRAIDPAGNRDDSDRYGKNVWVWVYIPPLPILAIVLSVLFGLILFGVIFYAYRRYKKKKALERYMAKRLARKLKTDASADADAAATKKRKKSKKKKKEKRRTADGSAIAARDAQMRNKFRQLLQGRAERSNRAEYELLGRRRMAKDVLVNNNIQRQIKTVQNEVAENNLALKDEIKRAKGTAGDAPARMGKDEAKAAMALTNSLRQGAIDFEARMVGLGQGHRLGGDRNSIVGSIGNIPTLAPKPSAPPLENSVNVKLVTRHTGETGSTTNNNNGSNIIQIGNQGTNAMVPASTVISQGNGIPRDNLGTNNSRRLNIPPLPTKDSSSSSNGGGSTINQKFNLPGSISDNNTTDTDTNTNPSINRSRGNNNGGVTFDPSVTTGPRPGNLPEARKNK